MHPQAIINEMFARQKERLQEAEAIRIQRRLSASGSGRGPVIEQLLVKMGGHTRAQRGRQFNTPVFNKD